jgi:hypothetical protein
VYTATLAARCRPAVVGAVIGAGALVKASMLIALPLYPLWLVLDRRGGGRQSTVGPTLIATVVAIAVLSPWLTHNVLDHGFGDPLALSAGAFGSGDASKAELGAERPRLTVGGEHGLAGFTRILFASWWGTFGWMEMAPDPRVMPVYVALTAAVLIGLGLAIRRASPGDPGFGLQTLLPWSVAAVAAVIVAIAVYSRFDFQPQGRYLLLASLPSSVVFAVGLRAIGSRWTSAVIGAVAAALIAVNLFNILWVIPWYLW